MKRNQRISFIVKKLVEYPSKLFTLNYFSEHLDAAKSSISEDILIVKELFSDLQIGRVETVIGASGGVTLHPEKSAHEAKKCLQEIAQKLNDEDRKILNEFIYYGDVLYDPHTVKDLGEIIAQEYRGQQVDAVMTIETKGIPLALMTANALNAPLVVARKKNKVSEGTSISVHYRSGTSKQILTMYAPKQSIKPGSKIVIVDDFLKGGGTIQGMKDLALEFDAEVVGVSVFIDAIDHDKIVEDYHALLQVKNVEDSLLVQVNEGR